MWQEDNSGVLAGEEFLSLVSDEIRNPLASITGVANFAEHALRNNDPASALESLDFVRAEARRILRMAEDLADAASVRTGKQKLSAGPVDLPTLVTRVAARHAATSCRTIDVCAPGLFPWISGDSRRITQVIETLISNAVNYSQDGAPVRVALEIGDTVVRISVTSQGMIIPPERQAMLFHRFSPLQIEGLYVSKQVVKMHGGSIHVSSHETEGTTFTVELPRITDEVNEQVN